MDNITQGVIGGSIYSLVTKKPSTKAIWLGAVITNIPDFDVFISRLLYRDPLDVFFFHRGIMHSIVFNIGLSLILGYFLYRYDKTTPYRRYALGCFLSILLGHLLIDGMTSYGMRYFLPRDQTVRSRDNIFVVDFGMRLITISGFVRYHMSKHKTRAAWWILGIVGAYISLSFGIQQHVKVQFEKSYPADITKTSVYKSITIAQPLQLALRRHIAKTNNGFYIADYSLFDTSPIQRSFSTIDVQAQTKIEQFSTGKTKIAQQLHRVLNFSRGMYFINSNNSGYQIENLLMGNGGSQAGSQSAFGFELIASGDTYILKQSERGMHINGNVWNNFWKRVRGK